MTFRYLPPLVLLASLLGCQVAPQVPDAPAPECCRKLDVANAVPLSIGSVRDIQITENSLLTTAREGTARAAILSIPSTTEKLILELLTERNGFWMPTASVYVPYLVFLSADLEILEQREPKLYGFHGRKTAQSASSLYQAARVPQGARYLVVTTAGARIDTKSVEYFTGGGTLQGDMFLRRLNQSMSAYPKEAFADERIPTRLISPGCCSQFLIRRNPTGEVRVGLAIE
jgi:hypothetical protein